MEKWRVVNMLDALRPKSESRSKLELRIDQLYIIKEYEQSDMPLSSKQYELINKFLRLLSNASQQGKDPNVLPFAYYAAGDFVSEYASELKARQ